MRLPGGWLIPALAVATSAWLAAGLSQTQALAGAAALGAGWALYAAQQRRSADR
jgi:hypothetical protein